MTATAATLPAALELPLEPPLRNPALLSLFLLAAILFAPVVWVGLVLVVATDAHREVCEEEEPRAR